MVDYTELLREPIKSSGVYVAGGFKPGLTDPKAIRLNANENPFGPSPKAIEAMSAELYKGSYYPGDVMRAFKAKLAEHLGVTVENLTLYNGSGSAINAMGDLFLNPGDEILISDPTYMQYYDLPGHYGAKLVMVPAKDGLYTNLEGLLAAITPKTKMIVICNPNNPTGTLLPKEELEAFINKLPESVLCLIDEAYIDWVDVDGYESAIKLTTDNHNLIVLRTFSKIYGMAGIRMGYAVANKALSAAIASSGNIFYSNRIAAADAMASITDIDFYNAVYKNNKIQRDYMISEMTKMGFDVVPSQTSFIYFNPHSDNEMIMKELDERFIFIRKFTDPYLRVSIGRPEQNQAFLDAIKEIVCEKRVCKSA